jgi:hypothetical protein
MIEERRRNPRFEMQLPIEIALKDKVGRVIGITRNVSAAGVYFYVEPDAIGGPTVEFVLTFPPEITLVKSLKVRCTGRVIRIDTNGRRGVGVATEIEHYEFLNAADA